MSRAMGWGCRGLGFAPAAALAVTMAIGPARNAMAGEKSLIAGLRNGDEMRYTYTVRCDETVGVVGKVGEGLHSVTTETAGILVRVKADTTALDIVEIAYESFKVSSESAAGKLEVDLGAAAPDETSAPAARDLYQRLHEIVGTVVTLNVAPGSGETTMMHGGEQFLKGPGGPMLRRYVDPDLLRATLGPIFQLKPNSSMPPPGEKWYVQGSVFAYANMAKSKVWETREVEGVLADIATVKGATHANGNPEDSSKGPVFFRSVSAESVYKWDTFRGRLRSLTRNEVIATRFERAGVMFDSDLASRSTLELVAPKKDGTSPQKAKGAEKPMEEKKDEKPKEGAPAGADGKSRP